MIINILGFSIQTQAQGNLLITPMRVVFEGTKQNEEFNLVNTGPDTTTFTISFLQYTMNEDGTLVKSERPETMQMSAAPYLRIYPSRVTLAPGEPQVIILQYRRKPTMVSGEYRSHLFFRAEKNINPPGTKKSKMDTAQLSIQLTAIYGLCLPIIIRTNEVNVTSTLSDLKLESTPKSTQLLKFTINRFGNISTYGDIIVEHIPRQGKPVQIAVVRGIGVYTGINKRKMVVKLNSSSNMIFGKGILRVSYITNEESKQPVLYAKSELDI